MSITDELRKWAKDNTLQDMVLTTYPPQHAVHGVLETLLRIADRIDAEHESKVGCTADEWDYWESTHVELPKDADGEYIHIGDVMDGVDKYDSLKKVTGEVTTISFDATLDPDDSRSVGIRVWSDNHKSYHIAYLDPNASVYRHHHEPTVEELLREMADRCYADEDEPRNRDVIVAEYAAKLRLAGDAE